MKLTSFFTLLLALTSHPLLAASGRTADGCTYQVINGQYLTKCGLSKDANEQLAANTAAPAAEPVSNYGSVPMRYEPSAPRPSIQETSLKPDTMTLQVPAVKTQLVGQERDDWREERSHLRQDLLDSTYAGAMLGANTLTSVTAGSALGLNVNLGTNIDDNFGFELGYSYSSQDLNLKLDSRGSADPAAYLASPYAQSNDSTLRTHLITGEFQGHFTDSYKRLRPFLGAGLGWKVGRLEENSLGSSYGSAVGGGSLSQSSLGGIGSAGLKFRVSRAVNVTAAFRYFFPILRQDGKLEQPSSNFSGYGVYPTETRLTQADNALTGSAQYQILGGLQYLF